MTPTCKRCGDKCNVEIVDNGIGFNDYGNHRARHVENSYESDCCEAIVLVGKEEITDEQYKQWEYDKYMS